MVRSIGSKKAAQREMMTMQELSWQESQKTDKALKRPDRVRSSRTTLARPSWRCPTSRSRLQPEATRASPTNLKRRMRASCLRASLHREIARDSSRQSTAERTQSRLATKTRTVDTDKGRSLLKISSSVSSSRFCSLQEWQRPRFSRKHRAMCKSWRPTTPIRSENAR